MNTITKKQQEKDSEVFGTIMAGAKSRKKPLRPELPGMEMPHALCAVGAGNRGRKITRMSDVITRTYQNTYGTEASNKLRHQLIPMIRFATVMEVSEDYVCGVNDGFEDDVGAADCFFKADRDTPDYERGWHVGQAVRIESGLGSKY